MGEATTGVSRVFKTARARQRAPSRARVRLTMSEREPSGYRTRHIDEYLVSGVILLPVAQLPR
jgi:hypothetical protein